MSLFMCLCVVYCKMCEWMRVGQRASTCTWTFTFARTRARTLYFVWDHGCN